MSDDRDLPDGMTCGVCENLARCRNLICTLDENSTRCDWSPNRFTSDSVAVTVRNYQARIRDLESQLAAERAKWGALRERVRREIASHQDGEMMSLSEACHGEAEWSRMGEAMDAISDPTGLVVESCRLYMADFMPDDGGEPCLGIQGQFSSVAMNDECRLIRRKGERG